MLAVEQPNADEMADVLEVLPAQFEEINPPAKQIKIIKIVTRLR